MLATVISTLTLSFSVWVYIAHERKINGLNSQIKKIELNNLNSAKLVFQHHEANNGKLPFFTLLNDGNKIASNVEITPSAGIMLTSANTIPTLAVGQIVKFSFYDECQGGSATFSVRYTDDLGSHCVSYHVQC